MLRFLKGVALMAGAVLLGTAACVGGAYAGPAGAPIAALGLIGALVMADFGLKAW